MKISKKCRYGLRALIDLSVNAENKSIVLGTIAERNSISPQYLEQIFACLRRAGIVRGLKGSQGGYILNVLPKELTVSAVIEALDGSYQVEGEECPEDIHGQCITASIQELVIDPINIQLDQTLKGISLQDLRDRYFQHKGYGQDMYYI